MASLDQTLSLSLEQTLVGELNNDGLIMRLNFEQVSNDIITDISPYGLSNNGILKNGTQITTTTTTTTTTSSSSSSSSIWVVAEAEGARDRTQARPR